MVAVAVVIGLHLSGVFDGVTVRSFLERRSELAAAVDAHFLRSLLIFVLVYTAMVALSIPGALFLTLASGFLFGPLIGGTAAVVSATTGATLLYAFARSSVGGLVRDKMRGRCPEFDCGDSFFALLFLRLVPLAPFWLVNIVPCVINMPVRTFALATTIGILPATFTFATIGAGLDSVLAAQAEAKAACLAARTCELTIDKSALLTPGLLSAFLALGVLALVPPVARAWKRRRCRAPS